MPKYLSSAGYPSIHQMTIAEFAEIQRAFGEIILKTGTIYWRRVRPFFFRPVLPYKAYDADKIVAPCSFLGGFQYVLNSSEQANSSMNFLVLDHVQEYSLNILKHERRRLIKKASRLFEVRPIDDVTELKERGYRAYMSFYKRTGYHYKADRTQKEKFGDWVDTVIKFPKGLLWGGYGKDGLAAVSISYWVEQVLLYNTFFCDTEALHQGVSELMFHTLRETAAQTPEIREIVVRQYQGGNGLDKYYLLRGCEIVRKPARLNMNPVGKLVLKVCLPWEYSKLCSRR